MTITAGSITQYQDIEGGETLQSVPWSISEDGQELLSGIQSFPLSAAAEEITAFLTRRLEVYRQDAERYETAQAFQAELDHAAGVAEEVSGITITEN